MQKELEITHKTLFHLIKKNSTPFYFSIAQILCFVVYYFYDVAPHGHAIMSKPTFLFLIANLILLILYLIVFFYKKKQNVIFWIIPFFLFLFNLYATT